MHPAYRRAEETYLHAQTYIRAKRSISTYTVPDAHIHTHTHIHVDQGACTLKERGRDRDCNCVCVCVCALENVKGHTTLFSGDPGHTCIASSEEEYTDMCIHMHRYIHTCTRTGEEVCEGRERERERRNGSVVEWRVPFCVGETAVVCSSARDGDSGAL